MNKDVTDFPVLPVELQSYSEDTSKGPFPGSPGDTGKWDYAHFHHADMARNVVEYCSLYLDALDMLDCTSVDYYFEAD